MAPPCLRVAAPRARHPPPLALRLLASCPDVHCLIIIHNASTPDPCLHHLSTYPRVVLIRPPQQRNRERSPDVHASFLDAGAARVLTKPVTRAQLLSLLELIPYSGSDSGSGDQLEE